MRGLSLSHFEQRGPLQSVPCSVARGGAVEHAQRAVVHSAGKKPLRNGERVGQHSYGFLLPPHQLHRFGIGEVQAHHLRLRRSRIGAVQIGMALLRQRMVRRADFLRRTKPFQAQRCKRIVHRAHPSSPL